MTSKPVIAVTISSQELPRLVHWRRMFDGLQQCGAIPLAVDCGGAPLLISNLLSHVDGLLLSGGGDVDPQLYGADRDDPTVAWVNPLRDANEISAFEFAWQRRIPVLAVCRGAQLVNAARGGRLHVDVTRDLPSEIPHRRTEDDLLTTAHDVEITAGSRVATWMGRAGRTAVNSQHHQGIGTLAAGFVPTALADDGLIEAYESPDRPLTAIQWHPEIDWSHNAGSESLVRGFVTSCRGRRSHPGMTGSSSVLSLNAPR